VFRRGAAPGKFPLTCGKVCAPIRFASCRLQAPRGITIVRRSARPLFQVLIDLGDVTPGAAIRLADAR
jgi:hypothetical protein